MCVCMLAKLLQSYPAFCDAMNFSLLCLSVHGILQARVLERVTMLSSRFIKDNLVESVFQGVTFRKHAFTSSKMAHICGEKLVILCVV